MRRHGRIAVFVGRKARKVDQQLAQRGNVKHGFPLTFAVCAAAILYGFLPDAANGADGPVLCLLPDHRAAVRAPRARVHVERRAAAQQTEQELSSKRHPIPHFFYAGYTLSIIYFAPAHGKSDFPFRRTLEYKAAPPGTRPDGAAQPAKEASQSLRSQAQIEF